MKSTKLKENILKNDEFINLHIETKFFYLCLLIHNSIKNEDKFKCSNGKLSKYTGFNRNTIEKCRDELISKEFIFYKNDYYSFDYIDGEEDNVLIISNKKQLIKNTIGLHQEFKDLNEFWSSNGGRKMSENKRSYDFFKKIRKENDIETIQKAIIGAIYYQGVKYKPQVMSFASLYEKWDNLIGHLVSEGKENKKDEARF